MGHGSPYILDSTLAGSGFKVEGMGMPHPPKKKLVNLERLISQMGVCTTPKDSIKAPSILVARQVLLQAASFQAIHFR